MYAGTKVDVNVNAVTCVVPCTSVAGPGELAKICTESPSARQPITPHCSVLMSSVSTPPRVKPDIISELEDHEPEEGDSAMFDDDRRGGLPDVRRTVRLLHRHVDPDLSQRLRLMLGHPRHTLSEDVDSARLRRLLTVQLFMAFGFRIGNFWRRCIVLQHICS